MSPMDDDRSMFESDLPAATEPVEEQRNYIQELDALDNAPYTPQRDTTRTEPQPENAPVETSQTYDFFKQSGAEDRLSFEREIAKRDEAKSARAKSEAGLFGKWGQLSEKEQGEWATRELDDAKAERSFWDGARQRYDAMRTAGEERGRAIDESIPEASDYLKAFGRLSPLGIVGQATTDYLSRKIDTERAEAAKRIGTAEQIIAGKREGAIVGPTRAYTEGFITGVTDSVLAKAIQGVGEGWGYARMAMGKSDAPTDNNIYAVGKWIENKTKEYFPGDPARQEEFAAKFAQGAGSMVGFMGPTLAASVFTRVTPRVAGTIAGTLGAFSQSGAMFDEATQAALKRGDPVDEKTRLLAYLAGFPIGATEAVPVAELFSRPGGQIARAALIQMVEEGGQEYVQTVLENLTARHLYDPDRNWDDGAWEGLAIGAILGGGMGAGAATVARRTGRTVAEPPVVRPRTPEEEPPEVKAMLEGPPSRLGQGLGEIAQQSQDVGTGVRQLMDRPAAPLPPDVMEALRQFAPELASKYEAEAAPAQPEAAAAPQETTAVEEAPAERPTSVTPEEAADREEEITTELPAVAADAEQYLVDTERTDVVLTDAENRRITDLWLDGVPVDQGVEQVLAARAPAEPVVRAPEQPAAPVARETPSVPLEDIDVEIEVEVAGEGPQTLQLPASEAVRMIDRRLTALERLRECLAA